jgi:hypothetical protein
MKYFKNLFCLPLLCFFFLSFGNVSAQEGLKAKYFGLYKGKINSFKMETAGYLMDVAETAISVRLNPVQITLTIGKYTYKGGYEIILETKDYFILEAKLESQTVPERILLYKKEKKLSRDGLYPQPNAILFKAD